MKENSANALWKIESDSQLRAVVISIRGPLDPIRARQTAEEAVVAANFHGAHSFLADCRKLEFSLSSGFDALSLPYVLLVNAPKSPRHVAIVHVPCAEAPHIFHFVEGMYRQAGYSVRFFTEFENARSWLATRPPFVVKPEICPQRRNDFGLNHVRTRQLWRFHDKRNPQHTR